MGQDVVDTNPNVVCWLPGGSVFKRYPHTLDRYSKLRRFISWTASGRGFTLSNFTSWFNPVKRNYFWLPQENSGSKWVAWPKKNPDTGYFVILSFLSILSFLLILSFLSYLSFLSIFVLIVFSVNSVTSINCVISVIFVISVNSVNSVFSVVSVISVNFCPFCLFCQFYQFCQFCHFCHFCHFCSFCQFCHFCHEKLQLKFTLIFCLTGEYDEATVQPQHIVTGPRTSLHPDYPEYTFHGGAQPTNRPLYDNWYYTYATTFFPIMQYPWSYYDQEDHEWDSSMLKIK